MPTITNTNHNILTLTEHLAQSINKAAGKVDKKVYGDSIQTVPPPPPAHRAGALELLETIGLGLLAMCVIIAWVWTWQARVDKVKERIFR